MEWRKGFLAAPPPKKEPRRKAAALPDEAFLPAEQYDFADDDEDAVDPRVAERFGGAKESRACWPVPPQDGGHFRARAGLFHQAGAR